MDAQSAKMFFLIGMVITIVIRLPHVKKSIVTKVTQSRMDIKEIMLLILGTIGFAVLPLIYVCTHWLSFADYSSGSLFFILGIVSSGFSLYLSYRAHSDLGKNWSPSLHLREEHQLIDQGVYARIRHPIYAAFFLYGIGQLLLLSNMIAGPAFLIFFTVLFALRVNREEKMMLDQFGDQYFQYMKRTKRILPYVY